MSEPPEKLTQREIAAELGMSPGSVHSWLIRQGIESVGRRASNGAKEYIADVVRRARKEQLEGPGSGYFWEARLRRKLSERKTGNG